MRILSVSTSSPLASAAVTVDGACVCERFADADKKHAETLMPLIDAVLSASGVTLAEIDLLAVDVGPGSFTGVRIGVSAVNAMAFALNKRIVPVDALLALATPLLPDDGIVCAMIDAGNCNACAALYEGNRTLQAPAAVETAAYIAALPAGARIVGDTAEPKLYPCASAVGAAASRMPGTATDAATPMYLRPSQAERLKKQREAERRHG